MVAIEPLQVGHVPAVTLLGHALFHESDRYRDLVDYDVATAAAFIEAHTQLPYGGWVALVDGVPVGMLLAHLTTVCFGQTRIASEDAFYVAPDHRGGFAAVKLLRAYEEWAGAHGAAFADLTVTSGIREDRTATLYDRLGFTQCGGIFRRIF